MLLNENDVETVVQLSKEDIDRGSVEKKKCCTMLSNSEFLLLLKQAPADMQRIQEVMGLSDSELFYVTNVSAGEGLMVLGSGNSFTLPSFGAMFGAKALTDFSDWADYLYDLGRPQLWAIEPALFESSLLGVE